MPIVASFPVFDATVSLTFPFCIYKDSIRRVALRNDRLLFWKGGDSCTAVNGRKECLGIEVAACLGRFDECHDGSHFKSPNAQEGDFP